MAVDAQTDPHERADTSSDRDITRVTAKATAAALAIGALAFGIWQVRSMVILLLLALTFAAAIRPGVEWLKQRHVPQAGAIAFFFVMVIGAIVLFFWLAVPPALHQIGHALNQGSVAGGSTGSPASVRERVLTWLQHHLHKLPTGTEILHPVATYGHRPRTPSSRCSSRSPRRGTGCPSGIT